MNAGDWVGLVGPGDGGAVQWMKVCGDQFRRGIADRIWGPDADHWRGLSHIDARAPLNQLFHDTSLPSTG